MWTSISALRVPGVSLYFSPTNLVRLAYDTDVQRRTPLPEARDAADGTCARKSFDSL